MLFIEKCEATLVLTIAGSILGYIRHKFSSQKEAGMYVIGFIVMTIIFIWLQDMIPFLREAKLI